MVPIAETIVDIDTVVIELVYTFAADHAVEGLLRFDNFTVEAEVLQVDIPIIS